MVIVFDMDNTLTDEFGSSVRPGMITLLDGPIQQHNVHARYYLNISCTGIFPLLFTGKIMTLIIEADIRILER